MARKTVTYIEPRNTQQKNQYVIKLNENNIEHTANIKINYEIINQTGQLI